MTSSNSSGFAIYHLPYRNQRSRTAVGIPPKTQQRSMETALPTSETSLPLVGNDVSAGTQPDFQEQHSVNKTQPEPYPPPASTPVERDGSGRESSFDEFRSGYSRPRAWSRVATARAWDALAPDWALVDRMLAALSWQLKDSDWCKDDGQWWPAPATSIKMHRWEDVPPAPIRLSPDPNLHSTESPLDRVRRERGLAWEDDEGWISVVERAPS